MHIQFLGTSGHGITKDRKLPSLLIDDHILLDCGEGTVSTLLINGISLTNLKAIFLSHVHADHMLGLVALLWQQAFYSGTFNLAIPRYSPDIFVPNGYKQNLLDILEKTISPFQNVNYHVKIQELKEIHTDPFEYSIGERPYLIDWIRTSHHPKCFAYKFNNQIVFTGDTGPCSALIHFVKGCKCIVHEATFDDDAKEIAHRANHSTPSDAAILAKNGNASKLYLYHLPDISKKDEKKFLHNAQDIFSDISVLHDGDILSLS